MKKCISLFILALAASAACGKIESEIVTPAETGLVPLTFTGLTDGTLTKTSLNSNFQIVWSTSDVINVFDGSGSGPENFNVTSVARDGLEATFSGSAAASSTYYAISPASAGGAYVSAGTMTTMLPATQTATAGSFDPAAALSVAQASDYQFQFKNVGALVGVTLGNDGITGITLEAIGGEVLAGTVEVNADGTLNSKTGDAYVQMTGTFAKDATYYFVVLPGTYASGLRVTLQKGSEYARFNMTASQTIGRNDNLTLGTLTGSKWKTAFAVGEDVQIKGSAEEGQGLAYVGASGYWNESIQYSDVAGYAYNYEIFTRLTAGQKFYFMADGGEKFSLDAAGDAVGQLANAADAYSIILLDTPPSDTLALRNALMASSGIFMPLDPSRQSLKTFIQFSQTVKRYKNRNQSLQIYGVIFSRYDSRQSLDRNIRDTISEQLACTGLRLYEIPRRAAIADCYNNYTGYEALAPSKEADALRTFHDLAVQVLAH